MHLSDFHYDLPPELIARYPLQQRSASRLFCLEGLQQWSHRHFSDILALISPQDLLICNDTRVIPARMLGVKSTGGKIEVFVERILDKTRLLAQVRASKVPKPGSTVFFSDAIQLKVVQRHDTLFEFCCEDGRSILDVVEAIGQIPLPPYVDRAPEEGDKERYQTVYAKHKGSVAAPTAGLHFDAALLAQLAAQGVEIGYLTLHVGAGTFSPVRVENIVEHKMHPEYVEVSSDLCERILATKARGGRVIAVGTTTARSLESACLGGEIAPFCGNTDIFIYPGFSFRCVDVLITNFHLPCSTLLMLVSAFGGYESVMAAYHEAVESGYRFFSYGDAMWVVRR